MNRIRCLCSSSSRVFLVLVFSRLDNCNSLLIDIEMSDLQTANISKSFSWNHNLSSENVIHVVPSMFWLPTGSNCHLKTYDVGIRSSFASFRLQLKTIIFLLLLFCFWFTVRSELQSPNLGFFKRQRSNFS